MSILSLFVVIPALMLLGLWLARNILFKSINAQLFGPTVVQIALGGANAPYEHLRTMATLGYNVSFGYGMTETAVTAYDGDLDLKARLSGCSGQLLPIAQAVAYEVAAVAQAKTCVFLKCPPDFGMCP